MPVIPPPDDAAASRLLAGAPRREDLDGDYGAVARLLVIAREGMADPAPQPDPVFVATLQEAIAAGAGVVDLRGQRGRRLLARGLIVAGVVGLGTTAAAAANGSLPGVAQDVAHDVANVVGLDIPRSGSQDGPGHGRSDEAPGRPVDPGSNRSTGIGSDGTPPGQGGEVPGHVPGVAEGPGAGEGVGPGGTPPGAGGETPSTTPPTTPGTPPANPGEDNRTTPPSVPPTDPPAEPDQDGQNGQNGSGQRQGVATGQDG